MDFTNFITRLDEETVQLIIGRAATNVLSTMSTDLVRVTKLQSVLLNIFSPQELLSNKQIRTNLLEFLRPNEAEDLVKILGLGVVENNYMVLANERFRDRNLKLLFDFFELPEAHTEDQKPFSTKNEIVAGYPLFSHQRTAIKRINSLLYDGERRALLHMPTGAGKTRTAMNIICDHLRSHEPTVVIWFANTEELCEQAYQEFERAWSKLGNRDINNYRYWGASNVEMSSIKDGFIVAGLNKMYSLVQKSVSDISKIASNCSLAVMDEAHMAIAPTYKLILQIMTTFNASLLGLSATPGRSWNDPEADAELANFFRKKKVTLEIDGYSNPVDYLIAQGYLAKADNQSLHYNSGIFLSQQDKEYLKDHLQLPESFLKNLSEDQQRNILIVKKVEELVKKHSRIILFALSVEHSSLFATVLQGRGINAFSITSSTHPFQRRRLIENYKADSQDSIVLCNYGILTTGFDAPRTSCAVITRPTDSLVLYSQMVGRAIRGVNAGGNLEAEIVTVADTALPGFDGIATAFFNWEDVW